MAVYVGPLLLVLLGLGGLIVLIGRRARAGIQESLPMTDVPERSAAPATRFPMARLRFPKVSGVTKRLWRPLSAVGRGGGGIVRLIGRGMRVVLRRPSARVPDVAAPASFHPPSSEARRILPWRKAKRMPREAPEGGQAPADVARRSGDTDAPMELHEPEYRAQTLPPVVSDSVTAPRVREDEGVESEQVRTADAPDVLDELAPQQREISVPKSWTSGALRPLRRERVASRPAPSAPKEALLEIEPLPSAPAESSAISEQTDEAESAEQSDTVPVTPFAVQAIPGVGEPHEEDILAEPSPVTSVPAPSDEKSDLALEPHVRERTAGRQKVVGRVRARKKESPRSRKREVAASAATVRKLSPSVTEMAEEGVESIPALLEKGQLARAEDILTDLLTASPGDLAAYRWLALVHIQRGEYAQAREVCEEGLRRDPEEISLYGPLGRAYAGLGQYSKALPMLQQAHNSDERNLDYLEQLLLIAARMDHRALVRVTAQKILALVPDHPLAKKHLARVAAAV